MRAPIAPKTTIAPLPTTKATRQAVTAAEPERANRVQFGTWVPAETKVPTTAVTAVATLIVVTGSIAFSPSMPPTEPTEVKATQTARISTSGVATSEAQYIPW